MPLILDFERKHYVVFSSVFNPGGCNIYSKYIYQKNAWVEEKLPSVFEQRVSNLYIFQNEGFKFIDLSVKQKNISNIKSQNLARVGPKNPDCSYR